MSHVTIFVVTGDLGPVTVAFTIGTGWTCDPRLMVRCPDGSHAELLAASRRTTTRSKSGRN